MTSEPAAPPASSRSTEALADRIARLSAEIDASLWRLLTLIREFDERNGWCDTGFRSCAHWLSWRTGVALGAARERVRVARALGGLPKISAEMRSGRLSYSKARALTRVATAETEEELLELAQVATALQVERLVRAWRRMDRIAEAERDEIRRESRYVRLCPDEDGTWVLRGRLEPEVGAALEKALEAASDRLYEEEQEEEAVDVGEEYREGAATRPARAARGAARWRKREARRSERAGEPAPSTAQVPAGQRRADAMGLIAECALAHKLDPGTRGDRYQVVVHVDADTLKTRGETGNVKPVAISQDDGQETVGTSHPDIGAGQGTAAAGQAALDAGQKAAATDHAVVDAGEHAVATKHAALDTGQDVSAETSRRLACDAAHVPMTHDPRGGVLDVGRKTRTIPPALRRALRHRDRRCRFPGCPVTVCDGHHVRHWADGGETKLDNLVLLCRFHHRAVHEEGFRVALADGGREARFYRPDGRPVDAAPAAPPLPESPVAALRRCLAEEGLEIDEMTAFPGWDGGPFDLDWAIDALWRPPGSGGGDVPAETSGRAGAD